MTKPAATGDEIRERLLAGFPATERRIDPAGIPTAVLEGGEGPPLVLLHGAGEFAATWMRVMPDLMETHRVIAPDLPGHGASGPGEGPLKADRVLSWLGELIERTCASRPVLAGHLLGGAIAARFACDHGDRLARLVLVDAYGLARFRPAPKFALAMVRFVARPTERSRDQLMDACMVDLGALRRQLGEQMELMEAYMLGGARTRDQKAVLRGLMPAFAMAPIPAADLARIPVPTALICGRHDLQVGLKVAEAASARHGWPLHVIENAADDPAFEQPEAFLEALRTEIGTPLTHTT
ncbi:alpha/beta fold hydrolase [Streptomyces sp. CC208A]|uniref:alpha/beta fold hydrolase n=1 Tax=Streptomyces sp. CC208A TaxID=3044573 RepID=UPI0024A8A4AE|nr:alpha/beta fold hydrolase [Streptomyces sp. CC208A]